MYVYVIAAIPTVFIFDDNFVTLFAIAPLYSKFNLTKSIEGFTMIHSVVMILLIKAIYTVCMYIHDIHSSEYDAVFNDNYNDIQRQFY